MATSEVTVTVENLASANGPRLTPVWVGFHDGQFQNLVGGEEALAGLEAIAASATKEMTSSTVARAMILIWVVWGPIRSSCVRAKVLM